MSGIPLKTDPILSDEPKNYHNMNTRRQGIKGPEVRLGGRIFGQLAELWWAFDQKFFKCKLFELPIFLGLLPRYVIFKIALFCDKSDLDLIMDFFFEFENFGGDSQS